jgi:hypothetical protein
MTRSRQRLRRVRSDLRSNTLIITRDSRFIGQWDAPEVVPLHQLCSRVRTRGSMPEWFAEPSFGTTASIPPERNADECPLGYSLLGLERLPRAGRFPLDLKMFVLPECCLTGIEKALLAVSRYHCAPMSTGYRHPEGRERPGGQRLIGRKRRKARRCSERRGRRSPAALLVQLPRFATATTPRSEIPCRTHLAMLGCPWYSPTKGFMQTLTTPACRAVRDVTADGTPRPEFHHRSSCCGG